jgi:hypothetical protein
VISTKYYALKEAQVYTNGTVLGRAEIRRPLMSKDYDE